jgi:DNA-binding NtrC family response regulator/streptogramin lyase
MQPFTMEDGLANNQVRFICCAPSGQVWAASLGVGISRYDGALMRHWLSADGLPTAMAFDVLEDHQGSVWFVTIGGVARLHDGELTTYGPADGNDLRCPHGGVCTRDGALWFSGRWGFLCYRDGEFTNFVDPTTWGGWPQVNLLEDQRGQIWFTSGDAGRGVTCFDGERFHTFRATDGLGDDRVHAVAEDTDGCLWFGTGSGLVRYQDRSFAQVRAGDATDGGVVYSLLVDRSGRLWCGGEGTLTCHDGGVSRSYTGRDGLPACRLTTLAQDDRDRLWLGTFGAGLMCFDGAIFQSVDRWDGLPSNCVQRVRIARDGALWVATEGGAARYQPTRKAPRLRIVNVITDQPLGPVHRVRLEAAPGYLRVTFRASNLTTQSDRMVYQSRLLGVDDGWQPAPRRGVECAGLEVGEYTLQIRAADRDLNYSGPAEVHITVEPDHHAAALTEALNAGGQVGAEFVGKSRALQSLQDEIAQAAPTEITVLVCGETGTGKGLVARALHGLSSRCEGPFVQVNCGALPEGLVESELFGHERGAFTGAVCRRMGKVQLAQGGTLFLDEIGDMPAALQVKLLRLLEEQTFETVGGTATQHADVRVIAATNRNLHALRAAGSFRDDLFYRLNAFPLRVPPLRERREDIPLLAHYFMERMATHLSKPVRCMDTAALAIMREYPWPGNVRELEHAVQRAVIVCSGARITSADLALTRQEGRAVAPPQTLATAEQAHIESVLRSTGWRIKGPGGAAEVLGLPPSTLRSRMRRLGIRRPGSRQDPD